MKKTPPALPENCVEFIDRLIDMRYEKHMTQMDLAEASSMRQSSIGRIESKRIMPGLETILKIVAALDCRLELVPIRPDDEDD